MLAGLLRIGFLHHQQIIWNKGRTVLTRTHYWFQHEPCWFVRKKNAPWYGKAGENSTVWDSPSPKFIMGGSDEEKFDHPTQKPMEVMRRPILNHTLPGESCLRLLPRQRDDADRRRADRARLLRRGTRSEVRRRHHSALAAVHGQAGRARRRRATFDEIAEERSEPRHEAKALQAAGRTGKISAAVASRRANRTPTTNRVCRLGRAGAGCHDPKSEWLRAAPEYFVASQNRRWY